jgi:hypothetical protein
MSRNHWPVSLLLVILLLGSLGCNSLSRLVLAPTPTATATSTRTPSPTRQPSPTARPTRTPTPLPTPAPGITLRTLPDGSVEFADLEIGYRLTFPTGWLVFSPEADELRGAAQQAAEEYPDLAPWLAMGSEIMAEGTRMMAILPSQEDPSTFRIVSASLIAQPAARTLTFPNYVRSIAQGVRQIPAAELLAWQMLDDLSGQPAGQIDVSITLDESLSMRSVWFVVRWNRWDLMLQLQSESEAYASQQAGFEAILQTLELLESR